MRLLPLKLDQRGVSEQILSMYVVHKAYFDLLVITLGKRPHDLLCCNLSQMDLCLGVFEFTNCPDLCQFALLR
mgnify:CR=1 FL=1